jgi:acyl dehydratase
MHPMITSGTIAHGFLTLSLMIMMGKDVAEGAQIKLPAVMGVNYGLNRVRFVSPVVAGKRIRLRTTLADVTDVSPDVYQLTYAQTVEIEDAEKLAMVAEWVTRQYLQPGS